jgi:hypothetical protein
MTTPDQDLTHLVWEFSEWTAAQNLSDEGDALDLLHHPDITPGQTTWLQDFIRRWDEAEARARKRAP